MNTMWIFLVIFTLVSAVHIIFIILEKEQLRRKSKVLIIPFLLAAYLAAGGTKPFFPIPALLFGWAGDARLLRIERKRNFILGLTSFLLGHLCYIITFMSCLGFFDSGSPARINVTALAVFIPLAALLGIALFRFVKPAREMFIPVILYLAVLEAMNLWGLLLFIFNPAFSGALIFSGCLGFLVSDTLLAYYTFRKLTLTGAVLIMVFYILAQAGIILGIISLGAIRV